MDESPSTLPGAGFLSGLLRHSLIYSVVPIATRTVSVLMIPLYTAWLAEAEYGVKEIVELVFIAFSHLLGGNVLAGMMRFYFDQTNEKDRRAVVSSSTLAIGFLSWSVCGVGLVFRHELSPWLLGRGNELVSRIELTELLTLTLLAIPFQLTAHCGYQYLLILKRSGLYTGIMLVKLVLQVALQIFLIGFLGWGVRGYLVSMLAVEALAALGLTGWTLWTVRLRIDWRILTPILKYTAPLVPVLLFQLGLHQIDRRLLEALTPQALALTWVGIYGLGYKIGYVVNMAILGPFMRIWQPWIFGVEDPRERATWVAKVTTYSVVVIASASICINLLARQAIELLASREGYEMAYQVVPWIATAYVFWSLYMATEVSLLIDKRTWPLLWVNLVALAANVGLNIVLVPRFGYLGSAGATLATFVLLAAVSMVVCHLQTAVLFEFKRLALAVMTVMGSGLAALYVDSRLTDWELLPTLGLKAAIIALCLAFIWFAILEKEEETEFLSWLKRKFGVTFRSRT